MVEKEKNFLRQGGGGGEGGFLGGAQMSVVETGAQRMGKPTGEGLAGKGREMAREVVFSERREDRARVVRPEAGRAQTRARHDRGRVGERPVAEWWDVSVDVMPTLRACRARPSGGVGQGGVA
jgi:hypothetical protein